MADRNCKLCFHYDVCYAVGGMIERATTCTKYVSAVDVVEVVRCKDCNRSEKRNGNRYCKYWFDTVDPFHYCSKGDTCIANEYKTNLGYLF